MAVVMMPQNEHHQGIARNTDHCHDEHDCRGQKTGRVIVGEELVAGGANQATAMRLARYSMQALGRGTSWHNALHIKC